MTHREVRASIAALEEWHARKDCADAGGHTLPEGYSRPGPADLAAVREEVDVMAWGVSDPVRRLAGLPEGAAGVPCAHCGAPLIAAKKDTA